VQRDLVTAGSHVVRRPSCLVPILLALSSACATTTPGGPRPLPRASVTAPPVPIPWSAGRVLTWSDFLGPPDVGSDAAAMTVYSISFASECTGPAFSFEVASTFLPDRSWVKAGVILNATQSALSLQHERTHFDVSELSARRLRHTLGALADACARPAAEINGLVSRLIGEDAETQRRYDRETLFGTAGRRQAQWDDFVRKELARTAAGGAAPRRWPGG
jgi:hypothetical protein